jgi:hypothetical protein
VPTGERNSRVGQLRSAFLLSIRVLSSQPTLSARDIALDVTRLFYRRFHDKKRGTGIHSGEDSISMQ